MKKKILSTILCVLMAASMLAGCSGSDGSAGADAADVEETADAADTDDSDVAVSEGSAKIGITIQSLKNDYWAGVMSKLQDQMKEKGYECTVIDCENNAATQVSQIENFITTGCDLIMVHPADADAVETVCGEALDAGIKVMCWDDKMENTTANWVLDNTALGNDIGVAAASFINEHYSSEEPAEVCVIGYPATKVLLERQNGIEAGLEENCEEGVYEIVAEIDGLEANEAQANVESVLSAHPDCSVFVGIGAGAMIGANEALLQVFGGAGNIPDNVGVIATDATLEPLESLHAGDEAIRTIIGTEGSTTDTVEALLDMFESILAGDDFSGDSHDVYRPTMLITDENIDAILEGM